MKVFVKESRKQGPPADLQPLPPKLSLVLRPLPLLLAPAFLGPRLIERLDLALLQLLLGQGNALALHRRNVRRVLDLGERWTRTARTPP